MLRNSMERACVALRDCHHVVRHGHAPSDRVPPAPAPRKGPPPPRGLSPPVQELHSFAQSRPHAYPRRGRRKQDQGGLVGKQLRFLAVVSNVTGSPWPRWLL